VIDGRKIRILRENAGLSTVAFAEKVTTSQSMVVQIEKGYKSPGSLLLKRIADFFGMKVDEFYV